MQHHRYSQIAGLSALGIASGCLAAQAYQGYAYASGEHRLLYQETHWLYSAGGSERRLVLYSCPDGEPFERKNVDTAPGAITPDIDLFDARNGYHEGVRTRDGRREVFQQVNAQAPERHAALASPPNAVIDAGFDAFVRAHWDALSAGGMSPVPFLVPSELGYLNFSARLLRDEDARDGQLRWFRLSLASWYGFVLPHIDIAYDKRTQQLREYKGVSNIRDRKGRNLNVLIQFPPSERRTDVSDAEVDRAMHRPLTGRCVLQ